MYSWWEEVNDYISKDLTHSIHTSERLSHRGCKRRHDWVFNQGYYPLKTPDYFEFGVAFHKGMQAFYNPTTWHDREAAAALAIMNFKGCVEEQRANYLKVTGTRPQDIDPEVKEDYEKRIQLGVAMLKYYTVKVSPEHDKGFTPIGVEIPFEVPILDELDQPIWCKCQVCWHRWFNHPETQQAFGDWYELVSKEAWPREKAEREWFRVYFVGLPLTYGGRIDMLAQDLYGRYWIFDWKTTARLSTGESYQTDDDYMLLDDQITSYCWSLWQLARLNGGKLDVAGFVYAQIKKAVPVEPEPLKHNRQGRWFSVNKQLEVDAATYERTVSELDPEAYQAGLYDDFITYLREHGGNYHLRHQIQRSETELRNAGHNIYLEALDMIDPYKRIYPSPGRFSCQGCAFQGPCLSKNRGEDYEYALESMYDKREHKYWETQPLSTDKKSRG